MRKKYQPSPLDELELLFELWNRDEVLNFISEHQNLTSNLINSHNQVKKYFPEADQILQVFIDPDENIKTHLTLYIRTKQNVTIALDIFDKLLDDWWLDAQAEIGGELSLNLEFR